MSADDIRAAQGDDHPGGCTPMATVPVQSLFSPE